MCTIAIYGLVGFYFLSKIKLIWKWHSRSKLKIGLKENKQQHKCHHLRFHLFHSMKTILRHLCNWHCWNIADELQFSIVNPKPGNYLFHRMEGKRVKFNSYWSFVNEIMKIPIPPSQFRQKYYAEWVRIALGAMSYERLFWLLFYLPIFYCCEHCSFLSL